MAGSWRETEIVGQSPKGAQCEPVFPVSSCSLNKRCPLNRLFSGKNSLTRLTRNAVICKAFPAKRFISCPLGKHQPLFFLTLTQSLMLALYFFAWCNWVHTNPLSSLTKLDTITGTRPVINTTCQVSMVSLIAHFCIHKPTYWMISCNNLWFPTFQDEDQFVVNKEQTF